MKNFFKQITSISLAFLLAFGAPLTACSRVSVDRYSRIHSSDVNGGRADGGDWDSGSGDFEEPSDQGSDSKDPFISASNSNNEIDNQGLNEPSVAKYDILGSSDEPEKLEVGQRIFFQGDINGIKGMYVGVVERQVPNYQGFDLFTVLKDVELVEASPEDSRSRTSDVSEATPEHLSIPKYGCSGGACVDAEGKTWGEVAGAGSSSRAYEPEVRPYRDIGSGTSQKEDGSRIKFYPNIDELEKSVVAERAKLVEKAGALSKEIAAGAGGLKGAVGKAGKNHNSSVEVIVGNGSLLAGDAGAPTARVDIKTPSGTDLGKALRDAEISASFLGGVGNSGSKNAVAKAKKVIQDADDAAGKGDIEGAKKRIVTVDALLNAARFPNLIPKKPADFDSDTEWGSPDAQRYAAYASTLDLVDAASDLDKFGLSILSSRAHDVAVLMLNLGLGLARFSPLVDIPSSIVESFSGTVVEFDANGGPVLRPASLFERSVAVGTVLLATTGFAAGGWGAAVGIGLVGGISKALEKQIAKHTEQEIAERTAKEIIGDAEKLVDSAGHVGGVRWGMWTYLPRTTVNGTEYANIGERLYTRHAIDRMTPMGYGTAVGGSAGRGIPTMVVEYTLQKGTKIAEEVLPNGVVRETWKMDTIEVVTEQAKKLVVTVMRKGG